MKNPAPSVEQEPLYHFVKGKGWMFTWEKRDGLNFAMYKDEPNVVTVVPL